MIERCKNNFSKHNLHRILAAHYCLRKASLGSHVRWLRNADRGWHTLIWRTCFTSFRETATCRRLPTAGDPSAAAKVNPISIVIGDLLIRVYRQFSRRPTRQENDNARWSSTDSVITLIIHGPCLLLSFYHVCDRSPDELSRALARSFICHLDNRSELSAKHVTWSRITLHLLSRSNSMGEFIACLV